MSENKDTDFLAGLGALALGSRLKRCADQLMADGQRVYESLSESFQPRWFPVVSYLAERGPTPVTGLARGLGVSHPGINKVVNELIEARLVASYRDRNDKRKRVIALTGEGREKVAALQTTWKQVRQALQGLADEGGGDFLQSLEFLEQSLARRGFYDRFQEQRAANFGDVEIVTFRPDLREAFRELNLIWIEHYFRVEEEDLKVLDNPEDYVLAVGGEIFFALDTGTGEALGTCTLLILDDGRTELAKMAVAEKAKGRQIGYLLGESVINAARAQGASTLFLESNRKLTPAITLYRRLGFVEKPFPVPSDYARADIYMELDLSA